MKTLPGKQAKADLEHLGFISDNGKRQRLYAFFFALSYSRIRYVQFSTRQDTLTFLRCLQNAPEYTGGVPQIILFDNAKTVVSEQVEAVIQFNRDLMRLVFNMESNRMLAGCMTLNPREK